MTRYVRALLISMAVGAAVGPAEALYLQPVLQGLTAPALVANAGDGSGRLFVVQLGGAIKVLQPDAAPPTLFLDIDDRVLSGGERGLLGLAFHPGFADNGRFFVHYTREPDGASVVSEFADAGTPDTRKATERVILTVAQPFANHNGGMIAFGPDGYLYIALGDGGSSNDPDNRAQNVDDLLGKILRIDVDGDEPYAIPPDNPFAGPSPGRDEIYAYGLRNPYRFSFDRQTGALLVGDVGQGQREEIDLVTLGANLGWRLYEGTRCTSLGTCSTAGLTPPVAEYSHTGGRCSVTGGYAYRGAAGTLPAGAYVFGDYCSGEIFVLLNGAMHVLADTTLNISSFGEDEHGELYVVGLGGTVHALKARRFPAAAARLPDLDGQGTADVLWHNRSAGLHAIWLMQGGAIASTSVFAVPAEWRLAATGDLDDDGRSDLVWRSSISGAVALWRMQGHGLAQSAAYGVGPDWDLVATADLTGDGTSDLLWRNVLSGGLLLWAMDGTRVASTTPLSVAIDWTLAGTGDVNADGTDDLVWRRDADGQLALWLMAGGQPSGATTFTVDPAWAVAGLSDVNRDGRADLLWRHGGSGAFGVWLMNGTAIQSLTALASSPAWSVAAVGDVNGDLAGDVFWRRNADGVLAFWFMNGPSVAGTTVFAVGNGWAPVSVP
jgi:hypothetical protein